MKSKYLIPIAISTCIFLFSAMGAVGDMIKLINYPLIHGSYKSNIRVDTTVYCLTDFGLMIWGISDLSKPNYLSHCPVDDNYGNRIAYYSNHIFVKGDRNVKIIDVSNPYKPILLKNTFGKGFLSNIEVRDSLLYLSSHGEYLQIYNIINPAEPELVYKGIDSFIQNFKICKNKLIYSNSRSLRWYNVSNVEPLFIDSIPNDQNFYTIMDYIANDNYLFVYKRHEPMIFGKIDPYDDDTLVEKIFIYDISSDEPLLVDSLNNLYWLYHITDSTLVAQNDKETHFIDISDIHKLQIYDKIEHRHQWYKKSISINDSILVSTDEEFGLCVYTLSSFNNYHLAGRYHDSGNFSKLLYNGLGNLFVQKSYNLDFFDKYRSYESIYSDGTIPLKSESVMLHDSIMIELWAKNSRNTYFSSISDPFNVIPLSTFDSYNAGLNNFIVFDHKFYQNLLKSLYDFSNPRDITVIANDGPEIYGVFESLKTYYNVESIAKAVFEFYFYTYDNSFIPQFAKKFVPNNKYQTYSISTYSDKNNPYLHIVYRDFYFYYTRLDISDLNNITETQIKEIPSFEKIEFSDDKIFLSNYKTLSVYDIKKPDTVQFITDYESNFKINDFLITGDTMYLVHNSCITALDISKVETSVDDISINENLNIYPNPNNGNFRICIPESIAQEVQIRVFTSLGKLAFDNTFMTSEGSIDMDLNHLDVGVYALEMINNGKTYHSLLNISK